MYHHRHQCACLTPRWLQQWGETMWLLFSDTMVQPWCNHSPPYLVQCCSVRSTQSTPAKSVLDMQVAQSYQQVNIWLCRNTLIQTPIITDCMKWGEIGVKRCRWSGNKWLKNQKRAMKTDHLTLDSKNICSYLTFPFSFVSKLFLSLFSQSSSFVKTPHLSAG